MYLFTIWESNVTKLTKKLAGMEILEICFIDDPTEPLLLHKLAIVQNPFRYHTYLSKSTSTSNNGLLTVQKIILTISAQLEQLLNMAYLGHDLNNSDVYDRKDASMNQMLATIWSVSNIFDSKSVHPFAN
ncbi:hypothetical protein DFQ29_003023 [Apophysomyces sp. BC1021]|nr:hypothetical protein DFQ29_003023 [Apophysomyces sp. BC1021]